MEPEVSVVIPYRDAAPFLGEAAASVAAQSFGRWELLLVNDGSRDSGAAVAAAWRARLPGKVRCLEHPGKGRRGAFASRLLGARRARAPVVALLDADDLWEPDYLRRHLALWKKGAAAGVGLSYGPAVYWFPWESSGKLDFVHAMPAESAVFGPGELLQNFLSSGYATVPRTSCSLILREAVLEAAVFEETARRSPYYEDQFLMWGTAIRRRVAVHPGAWVRYRQRWPLDGRPKSYLRGTLRDEATFLPVIQEYLARSLPSHPLLRPEGIPARLAALSGGAVPPYFFERIPAGLRRLARASL